MRTRDCPADILLDPDFLVDFVGLDVVVVDTVAFAVVFPPAGNIVVVVWPAAVVFCPDVGDTVVVCPSVDVIVVIGTVSTKIADGDTVTISQLLSQISTPSVSFLIPAIISCCPIRANPPLYVPPHSSPALPTIPIIVFLQSAKLFVLVTILNDITTYWYWDALAAKHINFCEAQGKGRAKG